MDRHGSGANLPGEARVGVMFVIGPRHRLSLMTDDFLERNSRELNPHAARDATPLRDGSIMSIAPQEGTSTWPRNQIQVSVSTRRSQT